MYGRCREWKVRREGRVKEVMMMGKEEEKDQRKEERIKIM